MHYYKGKLYSHYCPFYYKDELVEWAKKAYPNEPVSKWKKMKIAQLKAIWYNKGGEIKQ